MEKGDVLKLTIDKFADKIKESDSFANKWGDIGPVYGVQWRNWPTGDGRHIDQIAWMLSKMKKEPQKKTLHHFCLELWLYL